MTFEGKWMLNTGQDTTKLNSLDQILTGGCLTEVDLLLLRQRFGFTKYWT